MIDGREISDLEWTYNFTHPIYGAYYIAAPSKVNYGDDYVSNNDTDKG